LFVTSMVTNINHFNFFFTGFLSPMFFFTGVVFPIENLPRWLQIVAEFFPLTHPVRITRALAVGTLHPSHLWDLLYIVAFTILFSYLAVRRLKRRLID
ncbi:MAG: ABC transporter, partial [Spirochaetales bacterium]